MTRNVETIQQELEKLIATAGNDPSKENVDKFVTAFIESTGGDSCDTIYSDGQKMLLCAVVHAIAYIWRTNMAASYLSIISRLDMGKASTASAEWTDWAVSQIDPDCVMTTDEWEAVAKKALKHSSLTEEQQAELWEECVKEEGPLSLADIYEALEAYDADCIDELIFEDAELPSGHPGEIAFHFFNNTIEKLKNGMYSGLLIRFQCFGIKRGEYFVIERRPEPEI